MEKVNIFLTSGEVRTTRGDGFDFKGERFVIHKPVAGVGLNNGFVVTHSPSGCLCGWGASKEEARGNVKGRAENYIKLKGFKSFKQKMKEAKERYDAR